jgi:hypothetical protein
MSHSPCILVHCIAVDSMFLFTTSKELAGNVLIQLQDVFHI